MRRVQAQALRGRLQAHDIAVVVGAEDIQRTLETPFELGQQIAEVGGEIGGHPVVAHDYAVFVVTEAGGPEPGGAFLLIQVAVVLQGVDGALDEAFGAQRALGEEVVVIARRSRAGRLRMSLRQNSRPELNTLR